MRKIISALAFIFIIVAMINFIGVSYFKQANISSFKNYFIFYGDNIERFDTLLNDEKVPEETKNKILELVKEMNYEKFGKHLDDQVKDGENILKNIK